MSDGELARRVTSPAKKQPAKKQPVKKATKEAPAKKVAHKKVASEPIPAKKAAKKAPAKKAAKKTPPIRSKRRQHSEDAKPRFRLPQLLSPQTDPVDVVGLREPFTAAHLRRAWRTFAARHHPDQGGDAATFARGRRAHDELRSRLR